ncbi:MAG: hypothetical protein A2Z20_11630 [Bdellovibrionales bacterium RBG_16_40_8]|nr:MAG: hypothetical protein A2Z20_11630 [Bdellovibrionales bacterium RBG_16_40_8]
MEDPQSYLTEIKARCIASIAVASMEIVEEYHLPDRGYLRARLILTNDDFLEVAEYFVLKENRFVIEGIVISGWIKTQSVLRKWWDNVEHFPNLPNFPHHIHLGEASEVVAGMSLSIIELISIVEQEIGSSGQVSKLNSM